MQHQRHLRRAGNHLANQIRQQIRPNGVNHTQLQWSGQWIFAALGDLTDGSGLLQNRLRLPNHLGPQRGNGHFVGIALENLQIQLFFELLDGHRQGRLGHVAGICRTAEMPFPCNGNDVLQFCEGHDLSVLWGVGSPVRLGPIVHGRAAPTQLVTVTGFALNASAH